VLSPKDWNNKETGEPFWDNQWLIDRCRDAQFRSNNVLDIWARYHCKSTIKTFALTIFQLIADPSETIGIFSITKYIAEGFLRQIKVELEENELLKTLYPDIFYWEPSTESNLWTVEKGFNIKRPTNTNTANVEALGLVGSSYAGKRFSRQKYDDMVTEDSITSPEMIQKTTAGWELSMNTGMPGTVREYTGTFYGYGDTYHTVVKRGITLRLFPCYEVLPESQFQESTGLPVDLKLDYDKPTLFSAEHLREREREMGARTFGVQMLCNPNAALAAGFKLEWFRTYSGFPHETAKNKPKIILVDSANDKKKDSAYTAMWVLALGQDGVAYVVDGIRDRMDLQERTNALFNLHQRWKPLEVRYERYGMMVDVAHIQHVMHERHYHFNIIEVKGNTKKDDRIARLVPWFTTGKIYFPEELPYVNMEGEQVDLVEDFKEVEYKQWPTGVYKDMLDSLARMADPDLPLPWPMEEDFFDVSATNRWKRKFDNRRRKHRDNYENNWQVA
jgi:predicted phage terminase large subunit-like protein